MQLDLDAREITLVLNALELAAEQYASDANTLRIAANNMGDEKPNPVLLRYVHQFEQQAALAKGVVQKVEDAAS